MEVGLAGNWPFDRPDWLITLGKSPPLPCDSTAFVAKTLPSHVLPLPSWLRQCLCLAVIRADTAARLRRPDPLARWVFPGVLRRTCRIWQCAADLACLLLRCGHRLPTRALPSRCMPQTFGHLSPDSSRPHALCEADGGWFGVCDQADLGRLLWFSSREAQAPKNPKQRACGEPLAAYEAEPAPEQKWGSSSSSSSKLVAIGAKGRASSKQRKLGSKRCGPKLCFGIHAVVATV